MGKLPPFEILKRSASTSRNGVPAKIWSVHGHTKLYKPQHSFLSCHLEPYEDRMRDDNPGDMLCSIAVELQLFLSRLSQSTDEHLKLMVNFLFVSGEFLEFVLAYRTQNSITIEKGYQWFAPTWKILGQVKCLEAAWEQTDALYGNFPYSRLQRLG